MASISEEQKEQVKSLLQAGQLDRDEIASTVGVSPGTVSAIKAHITFGSCLAAGRFWSGVVGMATVLLIAKLKAEEALLARQFPDAYLQYRRRVKAIIPFLY